MKFKDVSLRTRRVLSLYKVYDYRMSQKKLQSDSPHQYLSKYRIDQSIISGYENITYYLPVAENRIRFGQVITQKYQFS